MITILETAPLNTVQDCGRPGYRNLGVGCSGVMDMLALQAGNILLENQPDDACIELQTFPFLLRFDVSVSFAVTGIDADMELDGQTLLPWSAATAAAGQTLRIGPPRTGARGYLCVAGGVDVPVILGSRSTQLRGGFGGLSGRFLEAGDTLGIRPGGAVCAGYAVIPPSAALKNENDAETSGVVTLRFIPATDYQLFTEQSRVLFQNCEWKITPQSNRVGYRLSGDKLQLTKPVELRSYGIVPGIVQVPPAGEPIVQMADANTAGGYPRIATVIEADLWRLAQARIGSRIRFQECSYEDGVDAMQPVEDWFENMRLMVSRYRNSSIRRQSGKSGGKK
ncbi:biotin-dependent carboxyltransferase family protein [Acetobacter sicerae]|uniref:Biotin-dependent carboxyltransferase family protein n=1 Tax=Acetobacter sicerae TaxID=85325 RepID=A0ABS8VT28_9PROT|nr:biotin-dependent carboxyltransferase family protein [Acetobacter sicerae]